MTGDTVKSSGPTEPSKRKRQRFRHLLLPLTVAIIVVDATLWATGIISAAVAVILFLAIELPLGVVVIVLLIRQYRRERKVGASRKEAFERIGETEPSIRMFITELANVNNLFLLIRGKRAGVDENTVGLSYAKGSLGLPIAFLVATVIEVIILHLVIPWAWVRVVVLIVSIYSVVLVLGYLAARVVHPHLLNREHLLLRAGRHVVARIPRGQIAKVVVTNRYKHTYPVDEGGQLHLASNPGTNVDLVLSQPVHVTLPGILATQRRSFDTREISLYLEDPETLATNITSPSY